MTSMTKIQMATLLGLVSLGQHMYRTASEVMEARKAFERGEEPLGNSPGYVGKTLSCLAARGYVRRTYFKGVRVWIATQEGQKFARKLKPRLMIDKILEDIK